MYEPDAFSSDRSLAFARARVHPPAEARSLYANLWLRSRTFVNRTSLFRVNARRGTLVYTSITPRSRNCFGNICSAGRRWCARVLDSAERYICKSAEKPAAVYDDGREFSENICEAPREHRDGLRSDFEGRAHVSRERAPSRLARPRVQPVGIIDRFSRKQFVSATNDYRKYIRIKAILTYAINYGAAERILNRRLLIHTLSPYR